MSGISFGFSKKSENKVLSNSSLRDASTLDRPEETDYITRVHREKGIKGTLQKDTKSPLIIPCIQSKNNSESLLSKISQKNKKKESILKGSALDLEAAAEVEEEALKENEEWENRGDESSLKKKTDIEIYQEGLSSAAEVSTLEDYETVPVEAFGLAMLRGMGWKASEGIGGFNKKIVQIIEPACRPKGLGLGATPQGPVSKNISNGKKEEPLELKAGAYALIVAGSSKGAYGIIDGLDESTGRAFFKPALGGSSVSISENSLRAVGKEEYKSMSKVINRKMYDEYKKKDDDRAARNRETEAEYCSKKKEYDRRSRSPIVVSGDWIAPNLRVRFLNKRYKNGKYYKTKMKIEDVLTPKTCDCRSELDDRLLEDVKASDLETVIPREDPMVIMVLKKGPNNGSLGKILKKDKRKCTAIVQSLKDEGDVWTLDFDDICQYSGSLADYDL